MSAPEGSLVLPHAPQLVFRQLHHDLRAFANHTMNEDDAMPFMAKLLGHELDFLSPVTIPPPQNSERQALQKESKVYVAGKAIEVSLLIQQEILKLSDEFKASEARCLEIWFLASELSKREWIERVDQLPNGSLSTSIPAAARHFFLSEIEYKLNLLKELIRLRMDQQLDRKRREFILTYTNKLLTENLLSKLITALEDQLSTCLTLAPLQQAASYWHVLVAETILFIVASSGIQAKDVLAMTKCLHTLCTQLNTVVAKVSPHIVNLTAFPQLFECGSRAGTSPEGVVKQVSCLLRAMTTFQMAIVRVLIETPIDVIASRHPPNALSDVTHAPTVEALHQLIMEQTWNQASFHSITKLAWASFLSTQVDPMTSTGASRSRGNVFERTSTSQTVFSQVESTPQVVKAALEQQVFTHLVHVVLQYLPDAKHDALLYQVFQQPLETLLIMYSTSLLVEVPTIADQQALLQLHTDSDTTVACWEGDCLENIIEYAVALCTRNTSFARLFWATVSNEEAVSSRGDCHDLLMACRDAAFKNPACLASYIRLVAAAATGTSPTEYQSSECAQLAFHHIKQNPVVLSWDHFFAVMNKYQKLLVEAEQLSNPSNANNSSFSIENTNRSNSSILPGARYIRPKELEALEAIQTLIQAVIHDHQLALVFFHQHEWSPVSSLVAFLQCHVQSSLKGEVMKTLALFAQVPEIAPVVWRQFDALQILRTTPEAAVYGHQDIQYELEQYESSIGRYPATRGFLSLLSELFENPHAWNGLEGDGRVSAIQYYFDYVMHVFTTLSTRKYVEEDEKWTIASGIVSIFKKILHGAGQTTRSNALTQGSLAYQILSRLLASHGQVFEKLLWIISSDGGIESLEMTVSNMYLEHSFFICLEFATKEAEAKHGTLQLTSNRMNKKKISSSTRTPWSTWMIEEEDWMQETTNARERAVSHALELILLVLEKDVWLVQSEIRPHSNEELLSTILFRHRGAFVEILQCIHYSKSLYLPRLSIAILHMMSQRVSAPTLVDLLVDSGTSANIMMGCMNHLWHVYDDEHVLNDGQDDNDEMVLPRRRRRTTRGFVRAASSSIRTAILDLLLDNLKKPAPNLSHVLLGLLHGEAMSTETTIQSGLDVILTLLSTTEVSEEYPDVAQRCLHVIYQILVQEYSSRAVIHILESSRYHFFPTQVELMIRLVETSGKSIGELNRRGWFLKTLGVYLHILLQQEPIGMKKIDHLTRLLLQSNENRIVLLQLLQQTEFNLKPPTVPSNQQAVALAEQVTVTMDQGYYKWLRIDIDRFCQALDGVEWMDVESDTLIQWAIEWNTYSETVAAESHALNGLRELIETIVLEYLILPSADNNGRVPELWQGLDHVQSNDVRIELISSMVSTVLGKVSQQPLGCAQLFEVVGQLLLLLCAELRLAVVANSQVSLTENRRRQYSVFIELMYKTISHTATATGNPMAAQNSRTLLYSGIVNILGMIPATSWTQEHESFFEATVNHERTNALATHVVDIISRDASEGSDVLRMTLAVSGLEAMIASTASKSAMITKILRERGYLVHFIGLFRSLCEMDTSFDHQVVGTRPTTSNGMDATTIGTIYECFLSFFTRVANSKEGAFALLEGGMVRVLVEMQNLPSHRPKVAFQYGLGGIQGPTDAYRRAEAIYARKWPPVVRLLSGLCASLGQNRMLAQQVLQVLSTHNKLMTGCLKLAQHETPTLSLLKEVSHTTFVLRYVTQFSDLCQQVLTPVKWDKIAQLIVRMFLLYASEVVPREVEDMSDDDSVWWQKTQPQADSELREDAIERIPSSFENELVPRLERNVARETVGLLRLTVFGEDKLYTSRMILCNTIAFCANRMVQSMDNNSQLLPGKSVLVASARKQSTERSGRGMRDVVDRRAFVATVDPLWSQAPAIEELVLRLHVILTSLQSAQQLAEALQTQQQEKAGSNSRRPRKPVDATILQHLIEYHCDTLIFVTENLAIVLMTHFSHFMGSTETKDSVQHTLRTTLETLNAMEDNKFIHIIASRLRELMTFKS